MLRDVLPESDIVLVDDSSPDGTADAVRQFQSSDPHVHLIERKERGLGLATRRAFEFAVEHNYDEVGNLDADFSHPPEVLPQLFERLSTPSPVDVVIGSRYVPGGGIEGWPWRRHAMSRAVNFYARNVLSLPIRDVSGSFRVYRGEILKSLSFERFRSVGYAFQEEVLYHCARQNGTFAEVPFTFVERVAGHSKVRARDAIEVLATLASLRLSPPV